MSARYRPSCARIVHGILLLSLCLGWVVAQAWARTEKGSTAEDLSRAQEWGEAPAAPSGDTLPARGRGPSSQPEAPSERRLGESETLDKLFPTGPAPADPDAVGKEIAFRVHQLGAESHESQKAVERLVAIGAPALPALRGALRSNHAFTRVSALRALGLLRDPGSASVVLDRLQDRAPEVRSEAVKTLGAMRSRTAAARIAALLADPSVRVRREIPAALARIRTEEARVGLISALSDRSPEVRRQAAQELPVFGDVGTVRALLAATRDRDRKTVGFAVRSLGEIGDPAARSRVQELTRSQDRFIRQEAVTALDALP